MKKIFAALFLSSAVFAAQSQTVEEIVAKHETAMGGKDKIHAIKQLEIPSTVKLGVMGQNIEIPVTLIQEKGKLFRRQIGGIMGMRDSYTMVTDTAGYTYIPAMRGFGGGGPGGGGGFGGGGRGFDGGGGGEGPTIIKMKPEELAAEQYQLDCDGFFAPLIDYASKGHTAQLVGTEKVSKVPCFKIKLTLKSGQVITYYIDSQTFLVKQMEVTGEMALNLTGFGGMMKAYGSNIRKDQKATVLVKEYKEFNGVQFPTKFNLSFGPIESEVETDKVQINEGLEEKWYHAK